jgi:hypothetical protein
MTRHCFLFALSLALCCNGTAALAQIEPGKLPAPNIDHVLDEVQKQIERLLKDLGPQDKEVADLLRQVLQKARPQPEPERRLMGSKSVEDAYREVLQKQAEAKRLRAEAEKRRKIPRPNIILVQDDVQKQPDRLLKDPGPQDQEAADQLRRLLQEARPQPDFQRKMRQPFAAGNPRWGGLQFKKVDAELQEKLGLPDNEGLVVIAITPNSPADKAGLKVDDVIVKLNDKAAPSDPLSFANLVKEQKENAAMEIVVVRDGKEETLKGVVMPQTVQAAPLGGRPGLPGFGGPNRLAPNRLPVMPGNPFDGVIRSFHMESNINGIRIIRTQNNTEFSGSYEKDDLKISLIGKIENDRPKVTEITIQEGKETTKFTDPTKVPAKYRDVLGLLMLNDEEHLRQLRPQLDLLFRGGPRVRPGGIPGIDNK